MHASTANPHALTDPHKWVFDKGDMAGQEFLDALDFVVRDRNGFASISNQTYHAVGAHDLESCFRRGDEAHENVAGEHGALHQFAAIAPTVHLTDQRQERRDALLFELRNDKLLVTGTRVNRVPMWLCDNSGWEVCSIALGFAVEGFHAIFIWL